MLTDDQRKFIAKAIETIQTPDIQEFAWKVAEDLPDYIWEVSASSTGKYHPAYTLGYCGLMKHMVATLRILNHLLKPEQNNTLFTSRQLDLLRVAALFHDGLKSGTQEEFQKSKYTKFTHPLLMADKIKTMTGLPPEETYYISSLISSHMGEWNIDRRQSTIALPKPTSEGQKLIHLADYLASRKDIIISFDDWDVPKENVDVMISPVKMSESVVLTMGTTPKEPLKEVNKTFTESLQVDPIPKDWPQTSINPIKETVENHLLTRGKYKGKTWIEVKNVDPDYVQWAKSTWTTGPDVSFLNELS